MAGSRFSFFLACTLCVFSIEAHWLRQDGTSHESQAWQAVGSISSSVLPTSPSPQSYIFSVPTPRIVKPTLISQGMVISSIIQLYEVCNTPGSNKRSCSTVFETVVTTTCSTILTYAFTRATISDCSQNITFSTQSSFYLATSTISSTTTPANSCPSQSATTYVQSIVSYYIAPWQSLAAHKPSNITVLVCEYDIAGISTCATIQEVWVVHTKYVPVITTSTLVIRTTLASVSFSALFLNPADFLARGASSWSKQKHHSSCGSFINLY
jgi:hypothetical protein